MAKNDYIYGYGHLNKETEIGMSIPQIAKQLTKVNYGQQRMLAEIVRLREASDNYKKHIEYANHTQKLREMLETGWY